MQLRSPWRQEARGRSFDLCASSNGLIPPGFPSALQELGGARCSAEGRTRVENTARPMARASKCAVALLGKRQWLSPPV
jgi:hypothetical protein